MRKLIFALAVVLGLGACAVTGTPVGQTQVRIKGFPAITLQQKTEEVFTKDSFVLVQSTPEKMVFQRTGGTTESIFYGDWTSNNTAVQVTVYFIRKGANDFVLRTDSRILRNPNSAFEDRSDLFDMQALKYKRYLNQVKKELKSS